MDFSQDSTSGDRCRYIGGNALEICNDDPRNAQSARLFKLINKVDSERLSSKGRRREQAAATGNHTQQTRTDKAVMGWLYGEDWCGEGITDSPAQDCTTLEMECQCSCSRSYSVTQPLDLLLSIEFGKMHIRPIDEVKRASHIGFEYPPLPTRSS